MTDYAVYQSFSVDDAGDVVPGASIEVRSEASGSLVALFSGRTGGALANPFTSDAEGYFKFHTVGDFLKIRIYTGPSGAPTSERIFRYVPVGLSAGYDVDQIHRIIPAGTVTDPGGSFASSPTTGMYSPGTNIWALTTAGVERMRIDASGLFGYGGAAAAGTMWRITGNLSGSTTSQEMLLDPTVQSGVTTLARGFMTLIGTQATAFTLAALHHFTASKGTFGAGSIVTAQVGFYASTTLTGAANNYGFYSDIAVDTNSPPENRWNFYGNGTARNYFTGALSIGATTDPGTGGLFVNGTSMFGDANHALAIVSSNARHTFDSNDYLEYNRSGNSLNGVIGGNTVWTHAATGSVWNRQQSSPLQTLTDGSTISTWDVTLGQKAKVTLGAAGRTMAAVSGAVEGTTYFLWVIQDGTGSRTITTWTSTGTGSFDFGAAGAPTLTTTASRADLLTFEAMTIGGTLKLRFTGIAKGFA